MGIKETLFGRKPAEGYNEVMQNEREKQFKNLSLAKARKEGKERADYDANGGLFGQIGRGMQSSIKKSGPGIVKKLKKYQKGAKNRTNPVDFMAPIRPMNMGNSGYGGTMPNIDNVMPSFMGKKRRE